MQFFLAISVKKLLKQGIPASHIANSVLVSVEVFPILINSIVTGIMKNGEVIEEDNYNSCLTICSGRSLLNFISMNGQMHNRS